MMSAQHISATHARGARRAGHIISIAMAVRAKTYIPTGKPEMIFTMWFRAMLRNVAQESHYPCGLFRSTWLKSVTLSVNYSARRPKGALHALWNGFFVFLITLMSTF